MKVLVFRNNPDLFVKIVVPAVSQYPHGLESIADALQFLSSEHYFHIALKPCSENGQALSHVPDRFAEQSPGLYRDLAVAAVNLKIWIDH